MLNGYQQLILPKTTNSSQENGRLYQNDDNQYELKMNGEDSFYMNDNNIQEDGQMDQIIDENEKYDQQNMYSPNEGAIQSMSMYGSMSHNIDNNQGEDLSAMEYSGLSNGGGHLYDTKNVMNNINEIAERYEAVSSHSGIDNSYQVQNEKDGDVYQSGSSQDQIRHVSNQSNGMLPISSYKLQYDSNPLVMKKVINNKKMVYRQNINIRFLKPPQPPAPGPLIIREVRPPQVPPAPPLIIRQRPPRLATPPPLILRERPPNMPVVPGTQVISKQLPPLPPPSRQVIIERYPQLPPKPRDVIIERWLPYEKIPKRKIIYQRALQKQSYKPPRNMIVYYHTPNPVVQKTIRKQKVIQMDPKDYIMKYSNSLLDKNMIMEQAQRAGIVGELANSALRNISGLTEYADSDIENRQMQPYLEESGLKQFAQYDNGYISNNLQESFDGSFGLDNKDDIYETREQGITNSGEFASHDMSVNNPMGDYSSGMFMTNENIIGVDQENDQIIQNGNQSYINEQPEFIDSLNDTHNGESGHFNSESMTNSIDIDPRFYVNKMKLSESSNEMGFSNQYNYVNTKINGHG